MDGFEAQVRSAIEGLPPTENPWFAIGEREKLSMYPVHHHSMKTYSLVLNGLFIVHIIQNLCSVAVRIFRGLGIRPLRTLETARGTFVYPQNIMSFVFFTTIFCAVAEAALWINLKGIEHDTLPRNIQIAKGLVWLPLAWMLTMDVWGTSIICISSQRFAGGDRWRAFWHMLSPVLVNTLFASVSLGCSAAIAAIFAFVNQHYNKAIDNLATAQNVFSQHAQIWNGTLSDGDISTMVQTLWPVQVESNHTDFWYRVGYGAYAACAFGLLCIHVPLVTIHAITLRTQIRKLKRERRRVTASVIEPRSPLPQWMIKPFSSSKDAPDDTATRDSSSSELRATARVYTSVIFSSILIVTTLAYYVGLACWVSIDAPSVLHSARDLQIEELAGLFWVAGVSNLVALLILVRAFQAPNSYRSNANDLRTYVSSMSGWKDSSSRRFHGQSFSLGGAGEPPSTPRRVEGISVEVFKSVEVETRDGSYGRSSLGRGRLKVRGIDDDWDDDLELGSETKTPTDMRDEALSDRQRREDG